MLEGELPDGYEAVFVLVFLGEDVVHHHLVMRVVAGVPVPFKLFPQEIFDLQTHTQTKYLGHNVCVTIVYTASDTHLKMCCSRDPTYKI